MPPTAAPRLHLKVISVAVGGPLPVIAFGEAVAGG